MQSQRRARITCAAGVTRCVTVTCGGGSSRQLVDVPVDEGQLLDDVLSQSFLQKQAAAMLLDGVLPVTLKSEHAVALNKVLTQVNFGAVLLEGAAAVRTGAFVIVLTHLREDDRRTGGRVIASGGQTNENY